MTGEAVFWLAFYGAFAGVALWATYRDRDLMPLGLALLASFLISNLCWFAGAPFSFKPGLYTMLQVTIAVATSMAFAKHCGLALKLIVAVTLISICANIWFAAIISPVWRQIHLWEVTTNICFAVECLLAAGVGVSHGIFTGRFHRWPLVSRSAAQSHAARAKKGSE